MSSKWINKNLFNSYVEQKEQDKENNDKASNRNDIAWKTPERGTVDNPKIYEGRFLPDPKGKFTKKYYYHMYQSAGKWFFQLCEKTFNFENWCPWCSAVSKLYQGTSADKKAASNFKRKVRHIGNWFVVDDPRDNEIDDENRKSGGKVKIYEFPTQVESKINGEIMDRKRGAGARVFDPGDDGLNFILKVKATRPDKNKRVFPDYSDSKFSNSSSSIGTDKEIKNILSSTFDLDEYLQGMRSSQDITKELIKNELLWDIVSDEWLKFIGGEDDKPQEEKKDEEEKKDKKEEDIPKEFEESSIKDKSKETIDKSSDIPDEKEKSSDDELTDEDILRELESIS